jgi:hypothetical protein
MRHRSHLPAGERRARARLAQIVHEEPLLRGSLVRMARRCGNPRCKCARGEKHVSLYLAIRAGERRRLIFVPRAWEEPVRRWVATWQEAGGLIDRVSAACLERLLAGKRPRG